MAIGVWFSAVSTTWNFGFEDAAGALADALLPLLLADAPLLPLLLLAEWVADELELPHAVSAIVSAKAVTTS